MIGHTVWPLLSVVTLSHTFSGRTGPPYCKRFFFPTSDDSRLSCSVIEQWPSGALESSLMFSLRTVLLLSGNKRHTIFKSCLHVSKSRFNPVMTHSKALNIPVSMTSINDVITSLTSYFVLFQHMNMVFTCIPFIISVCWWRYAPGTSSCGKSFLIPAHMHTHTLQGNGWHSLCRFRFTG